MPFFDKSASQILRYSEEFVVGGFVITRVDCTCSFTTCLSICHALRQI